MHRGTGTAIASDTDNVTVKLRVLPDLGIRQCVQTQRLDSCCPANN